MSDCANVGTQRSGRMRVDLQAKYRCDENVALEEKTTLMLRGIPRSCTQEELIEDLEALAGGKVFDFFYLPRDCQRNANMGFAFVNCIEPSVAREMLLHLSSQKVIFARGEPREVKALFAHVQGLTLNIAHYIGSTVVEEGRHGPVVLHQGRRLTFQQAVGLFVPPELVKLQLREAELARVGLPPQTPPTERSQLHPPKAHSPRKAPLSAPASDFRPSTLPLASKSRAPSLPNTWQGQPHLAPPHSSPAAEGRPGSLAILSRGEVLASEGYVRAWASLNMQLHAVAAIGLWTPAAADRGGLGGDGGNFDEQPITGAWAKLQSDDYGGGGNFDARRDPSHFQ